VHLDEKVIHVGKQLCYDLNAIDKVTKYVLAHHFVVERTVDECVTFLREIKTTCNKQIWTRYLHEQHKPRRERRVITFVSDKFKPYRTAWKKLFYRTTKLTFGVPIGCKKHGLKHNNNPIERYNQDIKDQIKTKRHFGNTKGAQDFLDLRRILKNLINPHQGLGGRTPAEAAGIDLHLSRRRLFDLIRQRSQEMHHSLR
jgi:transposase-like protein